MAALALIDALTDFGRHAEPRPDSRRATASTPTVDIEAIVAARVALAEAALRDELEAEHQRLLADERARFAADMQSVLGELGDGAARVIAERFAQLEGQASLLAGDAAARILGTLMSQDLAARSVAALGETVAAALADRDIMRVEARGPQSLLEALRISLGERAGAVLFAERPGFDLMVSIDGDLFETRLSDWSAALADLLAESAVDEAAA